MVVFLLLLLLPSPALAQSDDARFLEGLRERRLYALAESYGRTRLEAADLSTAERAELTIELARALAGQALESSAENRNALWQSAHDVLADLVEADPNNPRLLLLRVQDALVQLAHGQQMRQEAELTGDPEDTAAAQQLLHGAVMLWEGIARDVTAELRLANQRVERPAGSLTAEELAGLEKRVGLQLARTLREESLAYPAGSDERTASLVAARDALRPLIERQATDLLYWQSRLEEIACLRLLGRAEEALASIRELQQAELPPGWELELRAEELQLALAGGDLAQASNLLQQGRLVGGASLAELDLAILRAYLALAEAAREANQAEEAAALQQQAAHMLATIEQDHGAYHLRRAEVLLASSINDNQDGASLELLARTAATYYRRGQFDQAVDAFDLAAERAAEAGDAARAFEYMLSAASILHQRRLYREAAEHYATAARAFPAQEGAAGAHLAATLEVAQLVKSEEAGALEEYLALLEEHLATWPASPTANQAAWWLGRMRLARQEWTAARQALLQITPELPEYPAAQSGLEMSWRREIEALRDADGDYRGEAARAADYFEQVALGPERRAPVEWSPAARVAALAAVRMRLAYTAGGFAPAEALLSAALAGQPEPEPAWRAEAQALLVVALAGLGRRAEADAAVGQMAGGSPERLLETLEALGRLSSGAGAQAAEELANLQLRTIALLEEQRQGLTAAQQATLKRIEAGALATAGRRAEALARYRELAEARPDDGRIQQDYAELLAAGGDAASLRAALEVWRQIAARSPELSERWWQARYAIAEMHVQLGETDRAAEMIRLLAALHPELGGSVLKPKFEALLAQCE